MTFNLSRYWIHIPLVCCTVTVSEAVWCMCLYEMPPSLLGLFLRYWLLIIAKDSCPSSGENTVEAKLWYEYYFRAFRNLEIFELKLSQKWEEYDLVSDKLRWQGINKDKYNIECRNVWSESRLDFFIDRVRGIMLDGQIFRSLFWTVDQGACKTFWNEDLSHVVRNGSGLECGEDGGSLRVTVVLVRMLWGQASCRWCAEAFHPGKI